MKYCTSCGAGLGAGAAFCPSCGAAVASAAPAPATAVYEPAAMQPLVEAEHEQFLSGFSWGPGCGIYFWSRAMQLFLLLSVVLNVLGKVGELWMEGIDENDTGAFLLILLLFIVLLVCCFGLLVWAGRVARRRRWEKLKWRDFEHFREDELTWQKWGIAGWVLTVLVLILGIIMGVIEGLAEV